MRSTLPRFGYSNPGLQTAALLKTGGTSAASGAVTEAELIGEVESHVRSGKLDINTRHRAVQRARERIGQRGPYEKEEPATLARIMDLVADALVPELKQAGQNGPGEASGSSSGQQSA